MSELFVENDSVPPASAEAPVKKPRKKREPMSAEKKAEFAARMKASREQKKLEKEQSKAEKEKLVPVPKEKVEPKVEKVVKPKKNLRHVPNELDIHNHEIQCLKNELLVLKRNKKNNKDMEEIRALKEEMKELRDAAKAYKESLKKKEEPNIKVEIKEPVVEEVVEDVPNVPTKQLPSAQPINIPKPKYTTYQKSIWSQFT